MSRNNANVTPDTEIVLSSGSLRLSVSPYGASLRGLWRESDGAASVRQEIVTGYTGAKNKAGGQGDVLIPFPGRVSGGRYTGPDGTNYQMEITDKEGPNAIHGFLRQLFWDVDEQTENAVTFSAQLDPEANVGYPFALEAAVRYELTDSGASSGEAGMTCRFTVTNTGARQAPVAAGFHPYFTVGSETIDVNQLRVPMASVLEFDTGLIPTGNVLPVESTPFDFRTPRTIGDTKFNTCYLNPLRDADGLVRIRLEAPIEAGQETGTRALTVWMDQAFDYVVLYSGDPLPPTHRRRSLAIEPMTCGSDAFNHPEWGLAILNPGETLSGAWGVIPENR